MSATIGTNMKAVDFDNVSAAKIKALVYGQPGSGKTNFGVSAPKALILLSEQQAVVNIRDAARRLGRPIPPTMVMESLDDYRHVIRAFYGDQTKPFIVLDDDGNVIRQLDEWPETVVLDSITDIADMVTREIRHQSPPKLGKDNLPVDSERFWNVLSDRTTKLIRAFRDLPCHVVFLALLADKEIGEGDEKSRWVGPQMPMKALPNVLMAAVNVVGVTYRRRGNVVTDPETKAKSRPMVYGIATTGADFMSLKPYPPLRDYEVTDFSSWVDRINGKDDGSSAPPPMDPNAMAEGDEQTEAKAKPDAAKAETKPADKPADTAKPDVETPVKTKTGKANAA